MNHEQRLNRLSQRRGRDNCSNANPENPHQLPPIRTLASKSGEDADRDENEQMRDDCADSKIESELSEPRAAAVGDDGVAHRYEKKHDRLTISAERPPLPTKIYHRLIDFLPGVRRELRGRGPSHGTCIPLPAFPLALHAPRRRRHALGAGASIVSLLSSFRSIVTRSTAVSPVSQTKSRSSTIFPSSFRPRDLVACARVSPSAKRSGAFQSPTGRPTVRSLRLPTARPSHRGPTYPLLRTDTTYAFRPADC